MLANFKSENIVDEFIYEVKYGTFEKASTYLSNSVKTINYRTLKKILSTELNVNYLKPYYFKNNKNIHSILVINMNKQNDIVHFYLKEEKDDISNLKIYKIEKE